MEEKRITPEEIGSELGRDCIFVFGSNEMGIHGAGAAKLAYEEYGAFLGQGFGMMSNSFGIPTKDWEVKKLPLDAVSFYISRFIEFAKIGRNSKWKFYVTKIGCGLAGFKEKEIAPLFKECLDMRNVYLPQSFIDILEPVKV